MAVLGDVCDGFGRVFDARQPRLGQRHTRARKGRRRGGLRRILHRLRRSSPVPQPGGEILTRLPIHTKLYRDDLQRGYAHVRVAPSGESGWVENARLIWRLPAQAAQPQPAAPAQAPAADVPSSDTPKPTVAPSIFNPY
jgi:hypothetical protein